jgi:hypothetical protein
MRANVRGCGRPLLAPLERTRMRDTQIIRKENVAKATDLIKHTLSANWRESDAVSFERRVTAINDWLEHTEDLVLMCRDDEVLATELRSVAGVLKSRRSDFLQKAAQLRAELIDLEGSPD